LSSVEPEGWADKKQQAYVFKTHALADQLAERLRERNQAERRENGSIGAAFLHARTLGNFEWKEFGQGICIEDPLPEPTDPVPKNEVIVKMDPRRLAEVKRDPVEAWG
jgi:hypothetical protein